MNCEKIVSIFNIPEEVISTEPYGNGHINSTFLVKTVSGKRYILQGINTGVFKNPEEVMSNIIKVTNHLSEKESDPRSTMRFVTLRDGSLLHYAGDIPFRMFEFVENSLCLDKPECEDDFYECGVAFGSFQRMLGDFDASLLYETIPDFHNTEKRYAAFLDAVQKDVCGRAKDVQNEIEFVKSQENFYSVLRIANENGILPLRVTHNDTKINNVLLDRDTRKALCVIDLDTIMPGFSVTDFGDAIRSGATTAAEDENDISKVKLDLSLFEAFAKGFISGCGGALGKEEIMLFPEGAMMMTIECGMRFLTDYLSGDTYFKTAYAGHNLDRCRTQLKIFSEMEKSLDKMKDIVAKLV